MTVRMVWFLRADCLRAFVRFQSRGGARDRGGVCSGLLSSLPAFRTTVLRCSPRKRCAARTLKSLASPERFLRIRASIAEKSAPGKSEARSSAIIGRRLMPLREGSKMVPTKWSRHWAPAAWARSGAHGIRGSGATSPSRFFRTTCCATRTGSRAFAPKRVRRPRSTTRTSSRSTTSARTGGGRTCRWSFSRASTSGSCSTAAGFRFRRRSRSRPRSRTAWPPRTREASSTGT